MTQTLLLECPACGSDHAEPIAVGGSLHSSDSSILAMQCGACGLIYMSPRVESAMARSPHPLRDAECAAVGRMIDRLPSASRVLVVDAWVSGAASALRGRGSQIDVVESAHARGPWGGGGAFDGVFIVGALEEAADPLDVVARARAVTGSGGWIAVLGGNADARSRRAFASRHWVGYRFGSNNQVFGPRALSLLMASGGFVDVDISSYPSADYWTDSFANLSVDVRRLRWVLSGRARCAVSSLARVRERRADARGVGSLVAAFGRAQ